ncbi:50S ribosomal protein L13 [Peptostreptococcus russellii]|uniref:50S ribosomal protein L13 n=1 Tax=Peptostreptococcus russellii TaxID=215200 RepID=UPI003F58CF8C
MKSYIAKPADTKRDWYIVDAEGKTLGRIATEIATVLRGKNKPTFTPHVDGGDFVIVVNAEKVVLTGKKLTQKFYRYHTGYVGGLKEISYKEMMEKKPEEVVAHAVSGMLPKNKHRASMMTRLRVFRGAEHTHAAQNPQVLNFK